MKREHAYSSEIFKYTTDEDPILRNCEEKYCVLTFIKKESETDARVEEIESMLENAQSKFNNSNT